MSDEDEARLSERRSRGADIKLQQQMRNIFSGESLADFACTRLF